MSREEAMHQDFDSMTDEDIALLAQQGDADASEYLLNKYKNFVRSKARSYFLVGADHEDIVQEGMIGLFKAFRDFRPDKLASFHAFAEICVTRQIITAIKTATRQKHIPLNSYVSLNKPIYEEESDRTLLDVITEGRSADPEELLIGRESYREHRKPHRRSAFPAGTPRSGGVSGRQELSGNRADARPPCQEHRQRAPAGQAQAGKADGRARKLSGVSFFHMQPKQAENRMNFIQSGEND